MTQYYYIRNFTSGQAITVDDNEHHYAVLRSLSTSGETDMQQWHINSKGQIKSKGTSSKGHNYCLTMNRSDENTHILALKENDSDLSDKKSIFEVTSGGGLKNVHYGYSMHKVDDNIDEVGYKTIKADDRSSGNDIATDYQWVWIPVGHQYGLTLTSKPTTAGGLLGGTVDGALNNSYLRLYIYQQTGSGPWTRIGESITPRPNGSWAVNLMGANRYGVMLVVQDVRPKSSYTTLPTSPVGDLLAVTHFTAEAPQRNYAARSNGDTPVLSLNQWPFEFQQNENFTIQMWVSVSQPSTFFGTRAATPGYAGWNGVLLGMKDETGAIVFGISEQDAAGHPAAKFESGPTLVGDGGWHHVAAMRMGDTLAVFLDGTLLNGTQSVFNGFTGESAPQSEAANLTIVNQQLATFGGAYPQLTNDVVTSLPYSVQNYGFYGAIDKAQIWNKALTPYEIRYGMYNPVDNADPDLLGNWTFDGQNDANSAIGKNYSTIRNDEVTYDSDNVVQPLPGKLPYLTAQCKLMEDYFSPIVAATGTTYHTVLSLWDANGNRMPNAPIYLKADRNCTVYVPVEGAMYSTQSLTTNLSLFTTNLLGEFNFSYLAGDSLTAPMFSIQTDFMASDEWLLIFPDRHAHHSLATLTGEKLLNRNPNSSLTQKLMQNSVDLDVANSLASAVNNLMASALEHDVQADYPMILLVDEPAETVFKPVPRLYQNTSSARVAYNPKSNVSAMHYINSAAQTLERIVSGHAMPVKQWEFANNTFRVISESEVQARVKSAKRAPIYLNSAAAVNQAMIDSGKSSFTRAEVAGFVRQYSTGANTMKSYSLSDLWDDIKNAASVVVSVTEHLIEDVQEALHVVSIWIDEATSYVLETVDEAVSVIGGLFAKFAVEAQEIIDFIKSAFEWGDILETQRVLKQYLTQCVPSIQAQVNDIKNNMISGLDHIQETVDQYLGQAINALSDQTLGDAQSRMVSGDPQDIQSTYMLRHTTTQMASDSSHLLIPTMNSSDQNTIETVFTQLIDDVSADVEQLKAVIAATPSFTTLFSDPQAFFKAGMIDVISAVQLLWDVAMDLLKAGVEGIFDVFNAILTAIDTLMSTRIVIPFVTDLYERLINPNNTMTAYELLALFGAAPLTIAYKLANNGELPFDSNSQAVQSFMVLPGERYPSYFASVSSQTKGISTNEELLKHISWGLGFISSGAILLWGACNVLEETLGVNPLNFTKSLAVISEFTVFACSAPMNFGTDALSILNATIWGTFSIPLIIDSAALFTPKPSGAYIWSSATTWDLLVKPGINIALGLIHSLAFIASGTWETVNIATSGEDGTTIGLGITNAWAKTALNVTSVAPELDKVLWFSGEFAELIPLIDAAAYTTWGIGTAVMTTADLGANIETIIR